MTRLLCLFSCAWFAALAQYSEPVLTHKVQAVYSPEAREAKIQGTVYVYLEVDMDGKPGNVQVMHGLGMGLDQKAIDAVTQWRFKPGMKDGYPYRMARSAEISFSLDSGGPWQVRQTEYSAVIRDSPPNMELSSKPALSFYMSPDPTVCPAEGGSTMVALSIGTNGRTSSVTPANPGDPIGLAAAEAIRTWRFDPGLDGRGPAFADALIELECLPSVRISEDPGDYTAARVSSPAPTRRADAEYSELARKENYQGEVMVGGHRLHRPSHSTSNQPDAWARTG
jgi:TonB family protein